MINTPGHSSVIYGPPKHWRSEDDQSWAEPLLGSRGFADQKVAAGTWLVWLHWAITNSVFIFIWSIAEGSFRPALGSKIDSSSRKW